MRGQRDDLARSSPALVRLPGPYTSLPATRRSGENNSGDTYLHRRWTICFFGREKRRSSNRVRDRRGRERPAGGTTADLADERYDAPEAAGGDVLLRGLSMVHDEEELLARSGPMFEGLCEYGKRAKGAKNMKWVTRERPKTNRIACPWL